MPKTKVGVDVRGPILHPAVGPAGELAEDHGEQHDEGHEAEDHQRQLVVEGDHGRQHADDDEHVLDQVHEEAGEHEGDGVGVVGDPGHQLPHGGGVHLLVGQALDVGEQVLPHAGDDLLAHLLEHDGLDVDADHGHDEDARVGGHQAVKLRELEIVLDEVRHLADDGGGQDVVGDAEEHDTAHEDELASVGLGVPEEPADDFGDTDDPLEMFPADDFNE